MRYRVDFSDRRTIAKVSDGVFSGQGIQAFHVDDIMSAQSSDHAIFDRAKDMSAIVVRKDRDFVLMRG